MPLLRDSREEKVLPLVSVVPELTNRKMLLLLIELQFLVALKEATTAEQALLSDVLTLAIKAACARVCMKVKTEDTTSVTWTPHGDIEDSRLHLNHWW